MANEVQIKVTGGEQFPALARTFEQGSKSELSLSFNAVMAQGQRIMRDTIREANAEASGVLLRSVMGLINRSSVDNLVFQGEITFASPADRYVKYADEGRGSGGQPPLDVIRSWVRRKGLPENLAYPIARSIGARGTNIGSWDQYGRTSFIAKASSRINKAANKQLDKLAERIQRRLDNAHNNSSNS